MSSKIRIARARLAAALALTALVLGGSVTPAFADEPTLSVYVYPATEGFMQPDLAPGGVIEVYDAFSDLSEPVTSAPYASGGLGISPTPVDLPPGSYKVRASSAGFTPTWYDSGLTGDSQFNGLESFFGPRAESTATGATVITVGADGLADVPQVSIMIHDATNTIAGIVAEWADAGWAPEQLIQPDETAFVELYAVGAPEPIEVREVTRGAAFVFRDLPLGDYELRAILGDWAGAADTYPNAGLTPEDLGDPLARWYPGVSDRADAVPVTLDANTPHWDGASIAMDEEPFAEGFVTPVLSGDSYEGGTLFASFGANESLPLPPHIFFTVGYRWYIDGILVDGAASSSFVVPAGTAGSTVHVGVVTILGPAGMRTISNSLATDPITVSPLPVLTSAPVPTVTGTAAVGARLTAEAGTWGPGTVAKTYQWNRDGVPIAGATARTFGVTIDDVGSSLSVTVTGTKAGYAVASRTSVSSDAVPAAVFTAAPVPTIRGQLRVGLELTVGSVAWRPLPVDLTYQWLRDGTSIAGATGPAYTPIPEDIGSSLAVGVLASKTGYATQTATSAASVAVAPGRIVAPRPALIGSAQVGQTLSIDTSAWTPADLHIAYEWQRGAVPISGATGPTYVLTPADVGKRVRLYVMVSKPGYDSVERTTAPTSTVIP